MASKSSDWRPGPTVCRCCFADGCYKDISTEYFWMGKREVYSEMLSETFDLNIAYSQSGGPNSNSRLICEPCISRLRDASDFKRQVQECEKVFVHHLDSHGDETEAFEVPVEAEKEVKVEMARVKEESKLSDDDFDPSGFPDDDDDDLDDEPLTKLASKIPKKESGFLMDLLAAPKPEKRKSTSKTKAPPKKMKKKEGPKPSSSVSKPPAKTDKKKKGLDNQKLPIEWKMKPRFDHRDNAAIILECSNVCPFQTKNGRFLCSFCKERFKNFSSLKEHSLTHSNRIQAIRRTGTNGLTKVEVSDLKCALCLSSVKDIEKLICHLIGVHNKPIRQDLVSGVVPFVINDENIVCAQCQKSLKSVHALCVHMHEHYLETCKTCGETFPTHTSLKSHLQVHESGGDQFKCPKCDLTFTTKSSKDKHTVSVHGIKPVKKWTPLKKYTDQRFNAAATLECSNVCPFRIKIGKFCCAYCPIAFEDFPALKTHNSDHTNRIEALRLTKIHSYLKVEVSDLKCVLCPEPMKDIKALAQHLTEVHKKTLLKEYGAGVIPFIFNSDGLVCAECNESFESLHKLNHHMNMHYPNNVCSQCGKVFSQPSRLERHLETHETKGQLYKCKKCDKTFPTKGMENNHYANKHMNIKRVCKLCKKVFYKSSARLSHMKRSHGCTPKFACHLCPAVFNSFSRRLTHINRVHKKMQRFACEWCSYKSSAFHTLKVHVSRMHPGKEPPVHPPKLANNPWKFSNTGIAK